MEFTEFANLLKPIIGGSYNTKRFTRILFESMMTEDGALLIEDISDETFKAYFNGNTAITKIAQRVLANLEDENFVEYLNGFGDATAQILCDTFAPYIEGINQLSASRKITDLFVEILHNAAGSGKKKSTLKGAKKEAQTPHDILTEKILASGQVLADAWGKAVENLVAPTETADISEAKSMELPEVQASAEFPYSSADQTLLQEFTADYDEIMTKLMGENYAASLVDMTLPLKIQELYKSKWFSKADGFQDPTLKSYVFGLLGKLNQLSSSFLVEGSEPSSMSSIRANIRNLYVKHHPDSFSGAFPYDAFIDDWTEGEF